MGRLFAVFMLAAPLARAESLTLVVAAPTLQSIEAKSGDFFVLQLSQELSAAGAKVVTPAELQALLGIERQRQLMACDESSSSCLAELAAALGADAAVFLALGKFGERYQVTLKLLGTRDGTTLAQFSRRVENEEAVLDALADAAREMVPMAAKTLGREVKGAPVSLASSGPGPGRIAAPLIAGGAVLAVGGAILAVLAMVEHNALVNVTVPLSANDGMARAQRGNAYQWVATVGLALGGVLIAAGVITIFALKKPAASVALVPTTNGFALSGVW